MEEAPANGKESSHSAHANNAINTHLFDRIYCSCNAFVYTSLMMTL